MSKSARGAAWSRKFRSRGGRVLRRLGLLPAGTSDDLGDDDALIGRGLSADVIVFFPGTREALQDLEQWYPALRLLHEERRVLFVLKDSRTAARVKRESGMPAVTIAHYGTLDDVLARSNVKASLYVNHHPWNFSMLRFSSLAHVALLAPPNSMSGALVSNQVKAYDFIVTKSPEARRRVVERTDVPGRCFLLSRLAAGPEDTGVFETLGAASARIFEERDEEWSRVAANGALGP